MNERPYQEKLFNAAQKLVTTAGTAVALVASKKLVYKCKVRALTTNTGAIFIGDSTTSALIGYPLAAGVELDLADLINFDNEVFDLAKIFIDAAVNGEGISFVYFS